MKCDMAGLLVGLIAGSLGGLVGIGGGVIIVPLMTEMLKFRQQEAHGTSLVAVVFTGVAGSVVYYLHGSVDVTAAAILSGIVRRIGMERSLGNQERICHDCAKCKTE